MLSLSSSVLRPQSTNSTNAFTFLSIAIDLLNYWMKGKNPNIAAEVNSLVESMRPSTLPFHSETFLDSRHSLKVTDSERPAFLRGQSISQVDFKEKKQLDLSSVSPTQLPTFPMILAPTRPPVQPATYSPTRSPFFQSTGAEVEDFSVNTDYTFGNQHSPAVAALKDGGFLIAWNSDDEIMTQRYSSTGMKNGEDLSSSNTYSLVEGLAIAALNDGSFVATWCGNQATIYGQRYTSDVTKNGEIFQVSKNYTAGDGNLVSIPAISTLNNGGFIITWSHQNLSGYLSPYVFNSEILAQRYTSTGIKNGTEFQVNWYPKTDYIADNPSICVLKDGDFMITYSYHLYYDDAYVSGSALGQRYNNAGTKIGAELQYNNPVSTTTALENGGFLVTWVSADSPYDIFGQLYDNTSMKNSSAFQINTYAFTLAYPQNLAYATASLNDGGFVVIWNSGISDDSYRILGQRYNNAGTKIGTEFQVNSYITRHQRNPAIVGLNDGGFVVTWNGAQELGCAAGDDLYPFQDDNLYPFDDIFGQRFDVNGNKVRLPSQSYRSCADDSTSSNTHLILGLVIGCCGFSTLVLALCYYCGICSFMRGKNSTSNAYAPPSDALAPSAEQIELTTKNCSDSELIPDAHPIDSATPSAPLIVTAELIQEGHFDSHSSARVDRGLMLGGVGAFFSSDSSTLSEQNKVTMRV